MEEGAMICRICGHRVREGRYHRSLGIAACGDFPLPEGENQAAEPAEPYEPPTITPISPAEAIRQLGEENETLKLQLGVECAAKHAARAQTTRLGVAIARDLASEKAKVAALRPAVDEALELARDMENHFSCTSADLEQCAEAEDCWHHTAAGLAERLEKTLEATKP